MRLYLQIGHGMMEHCRVLLANGGGVILGPRELSEDQLQRTAADARRVGAEPLFDPQCYIHDVDHPRLIRHKYWQIHQSHSATSLGSRSGARALLRELGQLSKRLGMQRHILPGILARPVDEDWLSLHEVIIGAATEEFTGEPILATVALSVDSVRDEEQVEAIVERAADWPVAGFYVVAETPGSYLVDDPAWMANVLILTSGLQLLRKPVIFGYGNYQMLALCAANVDAMASGKKFYAATDWDRRRSAWYYCPQALTEYQIAYLDMARRNGVLDLMRPHPSLGSNYAASLFAGAAPSARWPEPIAFRHYLTCLRGQCKALSANSFDSALGIQGNLLDSAEALHRRLQDAAVFSTTRDFRSVFNANRSALITLNYSRGPRLRREWS